jgi:transposase
VNRLEKLLEGANITLAAVATSLVGKSARDRLQALLAGENDPAALDELARGRMRAKLPQLRQALEGTVHPFQRVILRQILAHIDFLETSMAELEAAIDARLRSYEQAMQRLQSSPGVKAKPSLPRPSSPKSGSI